MVGLHNVLTSTRSLEKRQKQMKCVSTDSWALWLACTQNGETITHANFFPYRDTFIPAHITYEQGDLRMELEQSKTETNGPFDPNLLLPPAGAKVGQVSTHFAAPLESSCRSQRLGQEARMLT